MCYSVCTTTNGGDAFSITGATSAANSAATAAICANDFLLITSAKDATNTADRFCGGNLNPDPAAAGNAASSTICSKKIGLSGFFQDLLFGETKLFVFILSFYSHYQAIPDHLPNRRCRTSGGSGSVNGWHGQCWILSWFPRESDVG